MVTDAGEVIGDDGRYEAVCSRDARFDGEFFFAVATTGIYCRPSCPATTPKRANVRFFPTAAAAQGSGFRACRRCRPDAVPGSAAWDTRADVVGRAMRLIADGVVDREGVSGLAARLGYSARQVQRQLNAEVGAGPTALARAQRAHTARILLQTTPMPVTDVAFAAGFASVRQFNDTVREIYAATPTGLRAARPRTPTRFGDVGAAGAAAGIPLRLPFRGPYAVEETFDVLAADLVSGVEEMTGLRSGRRYRRTLRLPHGVGIAEVREDGGDGWLVCHLCLQDLRDLTTATQRIRRLFDLDADPCTIAEHLGLDPALAQVVAARPGLRSPGTVDPHEFAVRVVAGGAAGLAARRYGQPLATARGGLTHLFPRARTWPTARSTNWRLLSGGRSVRSPADWPTVTSRSTPVSTGPPRRRLCALFPDSGPTPLPTFGCGVSATPTFCRPRTAPSERECPGSALPRSTPSAGDRGGPMPGSTSPRPPTIAEKRSARSEFAVRTCASFRRPCRVRGRP